MRVRLGAVTFRLAGGKSAHADAAPSRGKVRSLRGLRRLKLRVSLDVVDAAGNRATGVKRVKLRR